MRRFLTVVIFATSSYLTVISQIPGRPNILWITCEDISPAWGCYGDTNAWTPNIDLLARDSYRFTQAFSNAPICAPARSTLITGIYATSLGTQNLRSEIPVPDELQTLPELLRDQGYYTTNNAKTDYNFNAEGRWDESSRKAHWRNGPEGTPFFSVFNFGITHEGHANTDVQEDTRSLTRLHDPRQMMLPPYYPDTEEFRSIVAHQYDLISVFDQEVGKLLKQLDEDGLLENTIIFVFSDHGFGLPRYKRWLYDTGLRVPFLLHVPKAFRHLCANLKERVVPHMVGFVDFAPTVLHLAGLEPTAMMEGQSFLGDEVKENELIYGYRDRADDVYEMSRSVYDGRYLYIRHFIPQNPYIQKALIFGDQKRSFKELNRLNLADQLPAEAKKMFARKDIEELYDLQEDPYELVNLANSAEYATILATRRVSLRNFMRKYRDSGLLNEGEMMIRAKGQSVYEMTHSPLFDVDGLILAAESVSPNANRDLLSEFLDSDDAGVRYWGLVAIDGVKTNLAQFKPALIKALEDSSVSNRVLAAQILISKLDYGKAIMILEEALMVEDEYLLLQVAIAIRQLGERAAPLLPMIKSLVYPRITGDIWGKYRSWSYPMFIGMALDQVILNCEGS